MFNNFIKEINKNKAFKLLFSLIILSLFISPTLSQEKKNATKIIFGNAGYELITNNDGTVLVNNKNTNLMQLWLVKVSLYGKKNAQDSTYDLIPDFTINPDNWTSTSTKNKIEMKSQNITLSIEAAESNNLLSFKVENVKEFPSNKTKYNFTEYRYKYEFNHYSHLPYYEFNQNNVSIFSTFFEKIYFKTQPENFDEKYIHIFDNNPEFYYNINGDKNEDNYNSKQILDANVTVNGIGGKTNLEQTPILGDFPKNIEFQINGAYDLNRDNKINEKNFGILDEGNMTIKINQSNDTSVDFTTYVFGDSKENITQTITAINQNSIMKHSFTNDGARIYLTNKGDKIITYEINNYKFCTNETIKDEECGEEFGTSDYFEIALKVNFPDEKYKTEMNKGQFYTYFNFISEDKDAKIVSTKINDIYKDNIAIANQENYIFVRTTPFKGFAKIQVLFKFFDINKNEVLDESPSPDKFERLVFRNLGGEFLFTDHRTEHYNSTDSVVYKILRFDSVIESNGNDLIRKDFTENLNFGVKKNELQYTATSSFVRDEANVQYTIQPSKKNDTIIEHSYFNENGTVIKENVTLNEGEIYVNVLLNNWIPCNEKMNDFAKSCNNKTTDNVSTTFYLMENIPIIPKNQTDPDQKEEDIAIKWKPLNCNTLKSTSEDVDKEIYSESMVRFDFNPKMASKVYNAAFIVKYTKIYKPNPSGSYVYIIIGIIFVIIMILLTIFVIRRQNMRKLSGAGARLNDLSV